jgi:hypothetical protein
MIRVMFSWSSEAWPPFCLPSSLAGVPMISLFATAASMEGQIGRARPGAVYSPPRNQ